MRRRVITQYAASPNHTHYGGLHQTASEPTSPTKKLKKDKKKREKKDNRKNEVILTFASKAIKNRYGAQI